MVITLKLLLVVVLTVGGQFIPFTCTVKVVFAGIVELTEKTK